MHAYSNEHGFDFMCKCGKAASESERMICRELFNRLPRSGILTL